MARPIVVLDTETTASRGAPHLLELAALRVVGGEVVDQFESLVRPEVPIEAESGALHGITDADVAGAPVAPEVLAAFLAWLGDDWMAAHDAPKDARVLGFELARARLGSPHGALDLHAAPLAQAHARGARPPPRDALRAPRARGRPAPPGARRRDLGAPGASGLR